jgi:hypothetical protein
MRRLLLLAVLALATVTLSGQSTLPCSVNCTLARNQPFAVAYDWAPTTLNPDIADGFRLYQNGVFAREAGISALVNGSVAFDFPSGMAASGVYVFTVSAYTTGGETLSDPLTVTVLKGKPAKPGNGRVQ